MRGIGLIDILFVAIVVGLLLYAGQHDFARYAGRTVPVAVTTTPVPP